MMAGLRRVTRERQQGQEDSLGLEETGERIWLWGVDTGGRELDTMALSLLWADFIPGFADGLWYVTGLATGSVAPGTDFLMVTQTWRRIEYENPLEEPFRWTGVESMEIEIPACRDSDGRPIMTTAGEPILGLTIVQKVWRFTGTKKIAGIPLWLADYGRSVNSDTVRVGTVAIPPNQLQLQKVRVGDEDDSTKVAGRTIIFRPLEIEVWWNPATWLTEVLNMGFYELQKVSEPDDGDRTTSSKARWTPVKVDSDTPVFLNAYGQRPRYKDGTVKAILDPSEIVILKFNMNEKLPYSKLFR